MSACARWRGRGRGSCTAAPGPGLRHERSALLGLPQGESEESAQGRHRRDSHRRSPGWGALRGQGRGLQRAVARRVRAFRVLSPRTPGRKRRKEASEITEIPGTQEQFCGVNQLTNSASSECFWSCCKACCECLSAAGHLKSSCCSLSSQLHGGAFRQFKGCCRSVSAAAVKSYHFIARINNSGCRVSWETLQQTSRGLKEDLQERWGRASQYVK